MIGTLFGVYQELDETIDVNGVGYSVRYSGPARAQDEPTKFYVHTIVKEDSITLWAFDTLEEKKAFAVLTAVRGVGPSTAGAILSTIGVSGAYSGDKTLIATTKGVGPKMAETIVRELKVPEGFDPGFKDTLAVKTALENMGYSSRDVSKAISEAGLKDQSISEAILAVTSILAEAK